MGLPFLNILRIDSDGCRSCKLREGYSWEACWSEGSSWGDKLSSSFKAFNRDAGILTLAQRLLNESLRRHDSSIYFKLLKGGVFKRLVSCWLLHSTKADCRHKDLGNPVSALNGSQWDVANSAAHNVENFILQFSFLFNIRTSTSHFYHLAWWSRVFHYCHSDNRSWGSKINYLSLIAHFNQSLNDSVRFIFRVTYSLFHHLPRT